MKSDAIGDIAFVVGNARKSLASARLRGRFPVKILNLLSNSGIGNAVLLNKPVSGYHAYFFIKVFDFEMQEFVVSERHKNPNAKFYFDICDNFFSTHFDVLWKDKRKDLKIFSTLVDVVITPTFTLSQVMKFNTNCKTSVIPDFCALDPRLKPRANLFEKIKIFIQKKLIMNQCPSFVWFGHFGSSNYSGGFSDLLNLLNYLEQILEKKIVVNVITLRKQCRRNLPTLENIKIRCLSWSEYTHTTLLSTFDLCVLPIHLDDFTLTKSANRLVDSLAAGLHVIASPLPSYLEFANYDQVDIAQDYSCMAKRIKEFQLKTPAATNFYPIQYNNQLAQQYFDLLWQ